MYNDYLSTVTCWHFRLMLWLLDGKGNVFFNMLMTLLIRQLPE